MKVLIVGSGGREHALAWKIVQSAQVSAVFVAPGNAGTAMEEGVVNVAIDASDITALIRYAKDNMIDLTVVGPEAPLVDGIVDQFEASGLLCFGPSAKAAQLEGSKLFSKSFMRRHDIPTASYQAFTESGAAIAYLEGRTFPLVIKADGLAAGKGVVIAQDFAEAKSVVNEFMHQSRLGDAGNLLVVEQFLTGEEASFICMVGKDGTIVSMASSQDHKAAYDGDEGPNTGGMGAYSPAPVVDEALHQLILSQVIEPTVRGMAEEGMPYCGFLYAGIMVSEQGVPYVLEFNCRMGDPETQPVLMRLRSDLSQHLLAALKGRLTQQDTSWDSRPALGVVMASEGYPDSYPKGHAISGLKANTHADVKVFHAGTQQEGNVVTTSGGRVLCVTALADSVASAKTLAYEAVHEIDWQGAWYRKDIGYRAIEREND